ncbi:MAG: ribbon-helix-helix protein, CopG family [Xanthomonadales bacterium]|nr:ribbon-helix-helix protein, CopG family [Xanthomonadales bacterium]
MAKTLINLDPDDKAWLDREAKRQRLPMTELVRRAVQGYRLREQSRRKPSLQTALERTAGLWKQGDGLRWQRRLRDEWDRDA